MQQGPYIAERLMPRTVRSICERRGIDYQVLSDDWVLRLQKDDHVRWIVGWKFDVNTSAAGELAQDKVATYMTLAAADIPAVEHYLVRSLPHDPHELRYEHHGLENRSVVIKPLHGTGGRLVERYESIEEAMNMVHQSGEPAWAVSPHYNLRTEYRLVMLDGVPLLALEKTQPTLRGSLKLFNLGYGAVAVDIADAAQLDRLRKMAANAVRAMSLRLASVDIVLLEDGSLRVLEVNDGITLDHYAQQSDEYRDRAIVVYDAIVQAMFA